MCTASPFLFECVRSRRVFVLWKLGSCRNGCYREKVSIWEAQSYRNRETQYNYTKLYIYSSIYNYKYIRMYEIVSVGAYYM